MKSSGVLLLLVTLMMISGCHRPVPQTGEKAAAAHAQKKSRTSNSNVAADSANSDSSSSAEMPMQLSETEASSADTDTTILQLASLKAVQSPAVPTSAWKEGVHYKRLSPVQPTSALPGLVEVTEAFWYGSVPCYVLDQSLDVWLKQKPNFISFVRVPVMWSSAQRLHARMFYIASLLGKSDALHAAMFKELQVNKQPLSTQEQMQALFVSQGVAVEDLKRANASPAIEASLKHAQILGDRYRITTVPTIIVNGRYVTDVAMAGGEAQLLVLINELAARER
jgi:thiol:disulfide interchange protein DsbA